MKEQRIAVVGGGISGLGTAWLLSQRHDVTLIEANDYIGGHSNTVDCPVSEGGHVPVDTGFIVYNEPNYPNLTALFDHLGVPTLPSDMSFAFSARDLDLEYAGDNLNTLFAQRRNLLRPRFWRMTRDILRFNRHAHRGLAEGLDDSMSLGAFLDASRLGEAFRRYYLLPMSAAIWSCPQAHMLAFPAKRFLSFFRNHGLIQLADRPQWRTVRGGSREYVRRMTPAAGRVITGSPVRRVRCDHEGVTLFGDDGEIGRFDQVVIGAHADQALGMLESPSFWERTLLGAFRYQANHAWLHTDTDHMPRRRAVWASWNHLSEHVGTEDERPVSVTYWMNRLQTLPTRDNVLVTLNPLSAPREETVHRVIEYDHPVFDHRAVRAQRLLPFIQGRRRVWFCGSYFGYGFHEDGLASAVSVARALGAPAPWHADTAQPLGADRLAAATAGRQEGF